MQGVAGVRQIHFDQIKHPGAALSGPSTRQREKLRGVPIDVSRLTFCKLRNLPVPGRERRIERAVLSFQEAREIGVLWRLREGGEQFDQQGWYVFGGHRLLTGSQAGLAFRRCAAELEHVVRRQSAADPPRCAEQADVGNGMPAARVRATADVDLQLAQSVQVQRTGGKLAADCLGQPARQADS